MDASLHTISVSKSLDNDFALLSKELNKVKYVFYHAVLFFLKKKLAIVKRKASKEIMEAMDSLYLLSIGAIKMVDSYDKETAKKELISVRKLIAKFNSLKESLEKLEFYQNETLKERTSMCLSALFNLELSLKKVAHKGDSKPTGDNLKMTMANSSFSIAKSLN